MLRIILFIAFFSSTGTVFCQSLNITLLDNWHDPTLVINSSGVRYNDCWGYVQNGVEYAIAGSTEGTHFFRIGDDNRLYEVDSVLARYPNPGVIHRDIKTYRNYAYSVCDEGVSSLQIIDLSYLPDSVVKVADIGGAFGRVHNLFIDSNNALMYACIITPEIGGVLQSFLSMQVFSLADPVNPQLVYTGPSDIPEVHDAYVRDNIAYLNCGFDGLRVYDFSDPSNPVFLQNMPVYQDQGYNHQGWLSPDGKTYIFGDETSGKRLKKCNVDANHELSIQRYFGTNYENNSVPHNIMLTNEFAFVAYYNEGLRIYDLRSNIPQEIAHYDTYPDDSPFNMQGAWGVYTELPSGKILVSDRKYGLFLFDFRRDVFLTPSDEVQVYPNPVASGDLLTVRTEEDVSSFIVRIYNLQGQLIYDQLFRDQTFAEISTSLARGTYVMTLTYSDYLGDLQVRQQKIIVQ